MNQRSFGRKTEQLDEMHQMSLFEIFNELEALSDDSKEPEITEITISSHTRKKKSTRDSDLEGLPARIISHTLTADELENFFRMAIKSSLKKSINACLSFHRPLSWMNTMSMCMPLKTMMVLSSGQSVLLMFSETALQLRRYFLPSLSSST